MNCKVSSKCGGCALAGMDYAEQLHKKQESMEKLLGGFGPVLPIIGMDQPCWYRNKVHHAFGIDRDKNIISGSYAEGTHKIIQADECLLEDRKSQEIIRWIRSQLRSFKILVYSESSGKGLLRRVLVRRGFASGEIMVVLVTAAPVFPSKNNFVKALRKEFPEVTTVIQNVNDKRTSMILGSRSIVLYGPGYIKDTLCGLSFRISPDSFYQVNPVQTEKLYKAAIDFAGLTGKETVIDAYCGIGTIGLCAAAGAGKVIGVELNKDAVRDAIVNCKANRIENARFYQGDAGEFMEQMAMDNRRGNAAAGRKNGQNAAAGRKDGQNAAAGRKNGQNAAADVVFMDPPRSGSTRQFMDAVCLLAPSRFVYVSCDPTTLARDLKYLSTKGYRAEKIQPVDMFPFTEGVETVVCLGKKNSKPKDYVEIGVDAEEYYRIKDLDRKS